MTPEALRERAGKVFDAQHPRRGRPIENREAVLISEFPFLPGQVLRVEHLLKPERGGHRRSFVSFRAWFIEPGGGRFPAHSGFTISSDALPHLAIAVAEVLQRELEALPAWAGPEPRR